MPSDSEKEQYTIRKHFKKYVGNVQNSPANYFTVTPKLRPKHVRSMAHYVVMRSGRSEKSKSCLRPNFSPISHGRLIGHSTLSPRRTKANPRHGRPPCNARVPLLSCTSKHGAPALPMQASAHAHTHLPWHDEPQLHARKATAAHDIFPAALHDIHLDRCRWPRS